jgi:hypothetical protein
MCRSVFIPTQILNFALVPHHLRLAFVGVIGLFWSEFLYTFLITSLSPRILIALFDYYLQTHILVPSMQSNKGCRLSH